MNPSFIANFICKCLFIIFWKYFEQLFAIKLFASFNYHSKNEAPTWQKSFQLSIDSLECNEICVVRCQLTCYITYCILNFFFSTIPFIFDTFSSQDADFGFPDLDAFSIDSNPESNFLLHLRAVSQDT